MRCDDDTNEVVRCRLCTKLMASGEKRNHNEFWRIFKSFPHPRQSFIFICMCKSIVAYRCRYTPYDLWHIFFDLFAPSSCRLGATRLTRFRRLHIFGRRCATSTWQQSQTTEAETEAHRAITIWICAIHILTISLQSPVLWHRAQMKQNANKEANWKMSKHKHEHAHTHAPSSLFHTRTQTYNSKKVKNWNS